MLRSPFLKTLYEKRWTLLIWSLAIIVVNILLIQLFPPIKDAFAGMMSNIPSSLQGWFGDGQMWETLEGYLSMEIMGQAGLFPIIFAIIFSLSIFANEESSGLLLAQLSRPLSRRSYFLQKYLALLTACIFIIIAFWLGTFLGTIIISGYSISFLALAPSMLSLFLITILFGTLTFSLAAILGNKAIPGIIIAFYAVLGYFITSLRTSAPIMETISKATPFFYYNTPYVLINGLVLKNVIILVASTILPLIISLPIFVRRDLKTR